MDSKKAPKNLPAFTLIEVLVYIVIFTVVIGGLSLITLSVYRSKAIIEDRVGVNEDLRVLNKLIKDDMYLGNDVSSPNSNTLVIDNKSLPRITYFSNNNRIYRQVEGNAAIPVTSTNTKILTFEVRDLSSPSTAKTVRIRMQLSNYNVGTLKPQIVEDVTTTFSLNFI